LDAAEFYDGTDWRSVAPESLNDIGDVTITSATTGQVLEWNGTAWVNGQVDAAGIASDAVTTAKILNANVTRAKLATNLAAFTARETITATNASWSVPSLGNNTIVRVTVIGGGGGSGGITNTATGGIGGTTTFNAGGAGTVSAAGGAGGVPVPASNNVGYTGSVGSAGFASGNGAMSSINRGGQSEDTFTTGSGNGGLISVAYLNLSGISTVNVTIGLGGTAGAGGTRTGAVGGRGEVIVEYVAA
jgi:hypothetical protein